MFGTYLGGRAGAAVRSCGSRFPTMPLRAKVINPAFAGRAQMATAPDTPSYAQAEVIKELESDEKEDVLFNSLYGVRTIELNRPQKLHSLNGSMIRKIVPRLQEWSKSDMANVIIIKGSGPKAFCAGGDVAALAEDNTKGEEGQARSTDYFALEYKLDHLIATYQKPYVAFMDGITMGGGVGLSIHAPFRIATERTLFAMPETTIGFFPDVGASFFLPRMAGSVGTYLALTSDRLKGVNAFYSGIATHYIHSTSLPALEKRLAELRFKDFETLAQRAQLINSTIEEYCTGLPHDEPMLISGELRKAIDRHFSKSSVPEIIAGIKAEIDVLKAEAEETGLESPLQAWLEKTLATLHQRSPTSVHVALRQMRIGKDWSITETFQREYQIAAKFMRHQDFTEGIHSLLIRKDKNPQWKPKTLEDISPEDEIANPFFEVEGSQRIKLLSDRDYYEYPFQFGVPRESEVEKVVRQGGKSAFQVVNHFLQATEGKQGVKEVVTEIIERKTTKSGQGFLEWERDQISSPKSSE
ncbi:putative 3-hydroxyisobutyryl- hydrolase protein [Botrytis fragariae]|uniref:3-hydroxyisobutyryl-CoA hydrolase n=1 Tax=Botrytis fragariae TaxID=1964551 RepID=A0A8H6B1R8_9HELO|nr:putative 3-hydroxyisobutyryl- hydrolase protein [Botrytis fragariae]KAF5877497.1 putative 3-hydroxyisobutyryl- hydrolase protein [Botrytis fragariae]